MSNKLLVCLFTLTSFPACLLAQNNFDMNDTKIYSKEGYSLMADLSGIGENASVLFFDKTCTIIGLDNRPRTLYVSPEFKPSILPDFLQKTFHDIRVVIFDPPLESAKAKSVEFHSIPAWLYEIEKLEYLTFNYIAINPFFFDQNLPIKHLVFEKVRPEDKSTIIDRIAHMKTLEYLVHQNLFSTEEVSLIKQNIPRLTILQESEYDDKIEKGEIPLPDWSQKDK